jgi:lipopolysaccharide export LptBFGC system permease protein LptF
MESSDQEQDLRQLGRVSVFVFVGVLSALFLALSVDTGRRNSPTASIVCFLLSALFWWPLFKLGRYHAKKRRLGMVKLFDPRDRD